MSAIALFAVLLAAYLPLLHRDLKRADEKRRRRLVRVRFRFNGRSFEESMRAMQTAINDLADKLQAIGDVMKVGKR